MLTWLLVSRAVLSALNKGHGMHAIVSLYLGSAV